MPLLRRRGAALAALALLALAVPAPAPAQIGPRALTLYPLSRADADAGDASDVQSLLDAAVHRAAQRSEDIAIGTPLVARAACGPARTAATDCLARLAGGGLVLRPTVHRSGSALLVAIYAVDGAGRAFGPVSAAVDAYIQSAEPLANAVRLLVDKVNADRRRRGVAPGSAVAAGGARPAREPAAAPAPARVPGDASPGAPVAAAGAPAPAATSRPDLRAPEPAATRVPALTVSERPRGSWMRTAGPWVTGAGLALLAGGAAVATLNRTLSDELEEKFAAGGLTAADLESYDRVQQYNQLTAVLLASGGALTLGGFALWTAPVQSGPLFAGVAGRF